MARNITPRSQDYSQWYLDIIKVAELADYGLTVDKVMVDSGYKYEVNTALTISGTPTKAGTVEIAVTLTVPLVRGFGSAFPNNVKVVSPCAIAIPTTVVLTIGE